MGTTFNFSEKFRIRHAPFKSREGILQTQNGRKLYSSTHMKADTHEYISVLFLNEMFDEF